MWVIIHTNMITVRAVCIPIYRLSTGPTSTVRGVCFQRRYVVLQGAGRLRERKVGLVSWSSGLPIVDEHYIGIEQALCHIMPKRGMHGVAQVGI